MADFPREAADFLAESFIGEAVEGNPVCVILCEPLRVEAMLARLSFDQDEHLAQQIKDGKAGAFFTDQDLAFWNISPAISNTNDDSSPTAV